MSSQFCTGLVVANGLIVRSPTFSAIQPGDLPAGGSDYAAVLDGILSALDGNADPVDVAVASGKYVGLAYFGSQNANAWKAASNAVHTVATGKTLLVLQAFATINDTDTNRDARLYNVTDAAAVCTVRTGYAGGKFAWQGDATTPSALLSVASGKQVRIDIWNANTTKRAMGYAVLCREV